MHKETIKIIVSKKADLRLTMGSILTEALNLVTDKYNE